jgi:hypothetical protein
VTGFMPSIHVFGVAGDGKAVDGRACACALTRVFRRAMPEP